MNEEGRRKEDRCIRDDDSTGKKLGRKGEQNEKSVDVAACIQE